jgi:hypothetical protein
MSGVKKILLPQVHELRPNFHRHSHMVVDHKGHAGSPCDRKQGLGKAQNCFGGLIFRAELNDVRASVTQFPGHVAWVTPVQVSGVNKRIELQLVKWPHDSITALRMTRR